MGLLAGGGLWVGLFIGFWAGVAFAAARRAVSDFRKAKGSLPSLKKTVRDTRHRAASRMFAAAVCASLVLLAAVYIA